MLYSRPGSPTLRPTLNRGLLHYVWRPESPRPRTAWNTTLPLTTVHIVGAGLHAEYRNGWRGFIFWFIILKANKLIYYAVGNHNSMYTVFSIYVYIYFMIGMLDTFQFMLVYYLPYWEKENYCFCFGSSRGHVRSGHPEEMKKTLYMQFLMVWKMWFLFTLGLWMHNNKNSEYSMCRMSFCHLLYLEHEGWLLLLYLS